jgi:hypothetical protein
MLRDHRLLYYQEKVARLPISNKRRKTGGQRETVRPCLSNPYKWRAIGAIPTLLYDYCPIFGQERHRMSNQTVTSLVAKTEKGWRRLPVAFGRNGKIRPQYALVDGVPVHFPGSYYALRHFEGSKTVWTTVGENATDALAARDREQHLRQAKKLAVQSWRHGGGKRRGFPYAALHQKEMAAEAGGPG